MFNEMATHNLNNWLTLHPNKNTFSEIIFSLLDGNKSHSLTGQMLDEEVTSTNCA